MRNAGWRRPGWSPGRPDDLVVQGGEGAGEVVVAAPGELTPSAMGPFTVFAASGGSR
jgi:hypothetical protein